MAITAEPGERAPAPWRVALWGAVAALLLAPVVAMHFTGEVNWTGSDFAVAALLLVSAALSVEVAMRTLRAMRQRAGAIGVIAVVLVLVWLQGAVGLV